MSYWIPGGDALGLHLSLEPKMKRYGSSPSSVPVHMSHQLLVQLSEHDFL